MESETQALEEMDFLHLFSHHCESTVKTFGSLQTYPHPLYLSDMGVDVRLLLNAAHARRVQRAVVGWLPELNLSGRV